MTQTRCDGNLSYENRFHLAFGAQEFWGLETKAIDVTLPAVVIGATQQPTSVRPVWIPGDSIDLGDVNVTFLVDEDWTNYLRVIQWAQRTRNFDKVDLERVVTDMTIVLLDTKFKEAMSLTCRDCFPYSVSEVFLNQQVSSAEALRFLVTFKINGVDYE